jgi:hypothetical protein
MAVLLVLILIAFKVLQVRQRKQGGRPTTGGSAPFKVGAKTYFFSKAESAFFQALQPIAVEMGLTICPKVGLTDLFYDSHGAERHQANRYKQKHVDFLLLKGADFQPVAGIELDGKSHQAIKQAARDLVKDDVFRAAKLPLLRFQNQGSYDQSELRKQIAAAIGLKV